jgi:hypothetical protein
LGEGPNKLGSWNAMSHFFLLFFFHSTSFNSFRMEANFPLYRWSMNKLAIVLIICSDFRWGGHLDNSTEQNTWHWWLEPTSFFQDYGRLHVYVVKFLLFLGRIQELHDFLWHY